MPSKRVKDTASFVAQSRAKHGDRFDYSKLVYSGSHAHVELRCVVHDAWFTVMATNHLTKKGGCKRCAGEAIASARRKTREKFIADASLKHGDRLVYDEVQYGGATTAIALVCKEHGSFRTTPASLLQATFGFPACGRAAAAASRVLTTEEFVERSRSLHEDRFTYANASYSGKDALVTITCRDHGDFKTTPTEHRRYLHGGCRGCWLRDMQTTKRKTRQQFITEATMAHGNRYDYSRVEYTTSVASIELECEKHGPFHIFPYKHLAGAGCQKCGRKCKTVEEWIAAAKQIHGAERYDYSLVRSSLSESTVEIICKSHGTFSQRASCHLSGRGCRACAVAARRTEHSKVAVEWLEHEASDRGVRIRHAENGGEKVLSLPDGSVALVDGYCPERNLIFEFHGTFWHGHPDYHDPEMRHPFSKLTFGDVYERTLKREKLIRSLGYELIVMWEHDWRRLRGKAAPALPLLDPEENVTGDYCAPK